MQTQANVQQKATPVTNLLMKVEEKVPMVAPFTGTVRGMVQSISQNAPENDRLYPNVITGRGEVKQSYGEAIEKHNMPIVAIFPASSKTGLAALRALTGYPNRNACAKIQCIVRDESAIAAVRAELNEHLTDSITWSFADYTDEKSMITSFIGVDRLLIIPPSSQDRAELVCKGLAAARTAGVPHIVLMSAMVAMHPNTSFGRQFRGMEAYLEGLRPQCNFTHLRMAYFMDNFLDMASDLVSNNRFLSSWGPSAVSAVALGDVGRSAAAVLGAPKSSEIHYGRVYHLTGPESLSGFRMAEIFSKVLGRQISYQDLPRDEMRKVYIEGMKLEPWQADGYIEMNDLFKSGGGAAYSTDVAMLTNGNHTTFERFVRNKSWYFKGQRSPLLCIMPASGRVGTNTLAALMRDHSHGRIRAIVRSPAHKTEIETRFAGKSRLEVVLGDFELPDTIQRAFEGADSVLIIPPERLERFSLIDEAIRAAYVAGASHTILLSVSKALDATAIGRKFNAWERFLEQNSHSFTVIQSSLFHDLMFHFADQIKRPEHKVHHWLGSGRFCPVDSRDVGEACASVLREGPIEHHSHTYSLYGPQPLTFGEMCEILSKVLGYQVEAIPDISSEQVRATMQGKLPSFNVEEVVQAHEVVARGMDINITPDLIKLTGHAKTIQKFFEDYRYRFDSMAQGPTTMPVPQAATTAVPSVKEIQQQTTQQTTVTTQVVQS